MHTGEPGIYKIKRPGKDDADGRIGGASRLNGEWKFEYIFMDPPYNHEWEKQVLEFLTDTTLLADDGIIIVEASKETDRLMQKNWVIP